MLLMDRPQVGRAADRMLDLWPNLCIIHHSKKKFLLLASPTFDSHKAVSIPIIHQTMKFDPNSCMYHYQKLGVQNHNVIENGPILMLSLRTYLIEIWIS